MSLLDLRAALERDLPPSDYRRAVLRCALVDVVGFSTEDATAYAAGARLRTLPAARAVVERCWRAALRARRTAS